MIRTVTLMALMCTSAFAQETEEAATDGATEEAAVEEAPAPTAQTFTLDAAKSKLYVVVYNDANRWTPITGHDHAMSPTTFDGKVTWNVGDASACQVDISFPITALRVDAPGTREHAGLSADGTISDGQKDSVVGNMLGKHVLNQASFPSISFKSSSCDGTEGTVNVKGTLTVHGVGKSVTAPMTVTVDGSTFKAKGTMQLNHTDFGMKPYTMGPGTPKNQEKLTFTIDVVGNAT